MGNLPQNAQRTSVHHRRSGEPYMARKTVGRFGGNEDRERDSRINADDERKYTNAIENNGTRAPVNGSGTQTDKVK